MTQGKAPKFLLFALVTALTLIVTVYDSLPAYAKPRTYEVGDLVVIRGVPIKDEVPPGDASPAAGAGLAGVGPFSAEAGELTATWLSGPPLDLVQTDRLRLQLDVVVPAGSAAPRLVLELPAGCAYVGTVARVVEGRAIEGVDALGRVGAGGVVTWDLSAIVAPDRDSRVSVASELMVTAEQLDELILEDARLERDDAPPIQAR